jgi:hypothetical protein
MSFLFNRDKPEYTGLLLGTSCSYLPIPIVIGWGRLSPNYVWIGDYQQSESSSGKGFGKNSGQDQYEVSFIGMLCDGVVVNDYSFVWMNSAWYSGASSGLTFFEGYQTAPWSYMEVAHPTEALVYPKQAYISFANMPIGDSQALPNITVLVHGQQAFSGPNWTRKVTLVNGPDTSNQVDYTIPVGDADPSLLANLFLTEADWGVPDWPVSAVDRLSWFASAAARDPSRGDASWQAWCWANGLSLSLVLTSAEAASSVLERVAQLTLTAFVWSGDRLKAIPYGDSKVTANGYTYAPVTAPLFAFDDDDFVIAKPGDDSVTIERKDISSKDVPNCLRLEWRNAANLWNVEPVEAKDQGQIELYGLHIGETVQGNEITFAPVAQTVVQLLLQRALYIRNTFSFKLAPNFYMLDPMDLVSLSSADLGLAGVVARITSIEADETGVLTVQAEEYPQGVATAVAFPIQTIQPNPLNTNLAPDGVNPPVIFEPGPALTGGTPEVWVAVSGGAGGIADPNWGGAEIWASTDGETYQLLGEVTLPARMGVTTTTLAPYAGANPDTADTLTVTLLESGGDLSSTTAANAAAGVTLSYVGGELIAYQTATLGSGTIPAGETDAVPVASPYTVSVSQSAAWTADIGVTAGLGAIANAMFNGWPIDMGSVADAVGETDDFGGLGDTPVNLIDLGRINAATGLPGAGNALGTYTKVSSNPGAGQYSVAAGVYSFNAANAGDLVAISYDFTGATYTLSGLWRGLYGSAAAGHAAGVPFARLNQRIFKYALPTAYIGVPLYLKFASFNIFGNALQDLSTVEPYLYTPTGAGWLGPVASAMAAGIHLDMGSVAGAVTVNDNFGLVTDPYNDPIDLGMLAA